jgi:hypothetical protein
VTAEGAAQDDVERLYGVPPEEFMALRKQLVAAAKQRGDADAAKLIGAARRPTAAAWVVNLLVRRDETARPRLGELTEALRAAHSAMDGSRIRELTSTQRKLIDTLVRAGLAAAGYADATAAMRNDVTDTLQAAIADPDVAARLGRLEKAERWSGFGDFGETSAVATPSSKKPKAPGRVVEPAPTDADAAAARERIAAARRDVEIAERAHAVSADVLAERTTELTTARRRYEKLLESLNAAERVLGSADDNHAAAEEAARVASDAVESAKSLLAEAESDVQRFAAKTDRSS